jgi:hypothetical protein
MSHSVITLAEMADHLDVLAMQRSAKPLSRGLDRRHNGQPRAVVPAGKDPYREFYCLIGRV